MTLTTTDPAEPLDGTRLAALLAAADRLADAADTWTPDPNRLWAAVGEYRIIRHGTANPTT